MDEEGVSPVIGTILVLAILTIVTSTLLTVIWPQIQDSRDQGDFQLVTGQMARISEDITQMAMGGNVGETRQRTVATSHGQLGSEPGHLWGLAIAVADENYSNVQGSGNNVERGHHQSFRITDHAGAQGDHFVVEYTNDDGAMNLHCSLYRLSASSWRDHSPDFSGGCDGSSVGHEDEIEVKLTGDMTLRQGPWYLEIRDGDGDLVGQVYVYELNRIQYFIEGALMPRGVYIENGAMFTQTDTSFFATAPGLYRTAATGGTSGLNMRIADLDDPNMGATSGRAKTSFQLTLKTQDHLAHNLGAIESRLQVLDGPLTEQWATHMVGEHFDPATDHKSVAFTLGTEDPDQISPFPMSVIHSEIRLRMVAN